MDTNLLGQQVKLLKTLGFLLFSFRRAEAQNTIRSRAISVHSRSVGHTPACRMPGRGSHKDWEAETAWEGCSSYIAPCLWTEAPRAYFSGKKTERPGRGNVADRLREFKEASKIEKGQNPGSAKHCKVALSREPHKAFPPSDYPALC